ncbi:MAG: 2OG-Fe(II) oxygenase, partial [Bradymonadia bacterium]
QWYNTAGVDRKLSVTVQLDDEGVYSGGELEFEELQTSANLRARGTVLVFPSYLRHRVTPVTNGVRRALVAWFYGPEWR